MVAPEAEAPGAPNSALHDWALATASNSTTDRDLTPHLAQILAFNDPSDLLTFEVPPIPHARVVNLYDRNEFDFFGLIADPVAAHTGHSHNPGVLKVLFERRTTR